MITGVTITDLSTLQLRPPCAQDGKNVHSLVSQCPPLDTNSVYCNLLQCHHFASTSVVAENNKQLIGFISGYQIPETPEILFIWQVALAKPYRGRGLARYMLLNVLQREACESICRIHTTITSDNKASGGMFKRLANALETDIYHKPLFDSDQHFGGEHASEVLVSIGPFHRKTIHMNANKEFNL